MLTENDRTIVEQALIRLAETFRVSPLSKTALTDYFEGLKELTPKQFFQALDYLKKHHRKKSKDDFPLPADIIAVLEEAKPEPVAYEPLSRPQIKAMTPEERKEFADYLKERFEAGVRGEPWRPMASGKGLVEPKEAIQVLNTLLMPYGLANNIKKALKKTLENK